MSSYNSRKKEYAKKLLNNHIKDNFYNGTKPEVKYSIITKDGITDVDSKLVDYLSSETGLTRIQATDLIINEYNNFKKKYEHDRMIYNINQPTYEQKFKKYERDYKRSEFHNKNRLIMRIDQYSNYNFHESGEINSMYTEEELLESVEMLMEDYDLTEDEALDILMEDYDYDFDDYELEEISEALDILMEDYGYDEEEAFDILMEAKNTDKETDIAAILNKTLDERKLSTRLKRKYKAGRAKVSSKLRSGKQRIGSAYEDAQDSFRRTRKKIKKNHKRRIKRRLRKKRIKRVKKALHLK